MRRRQRLNVEWPSSEFCQLTIPEAIDGVVVHQTHRLHEGITDSRADEFEAALQQVLAHGVGLTGSGGDLPQIFPGIDLRLAADESPNIGIKAAELSLDFEEGLGVLDRGSNFELIANDAWIGQQGFDFALAVFGDLPRLKIIEGRAEVGALIQNGLPTQTGLCALQNQKLKQHAVIMARHPPLRIMISDA